MTAMEMVEKAQLVERPRIKPGDTVRVHVRVKEGDKERIQVFEGVVINLRRGGIRPPSRCARCRSGRGRAHLPAAFADDPEGGYRALGQGPPRQLYFLRELKARRRA